MVYSAKGQFFSHPAVGYHFVDASKVIGNVHTFSIAEGFANRAEVGYTRSVHTEGDSALFSSLWHFPGMNIFSGKVVAIKDGQFGPWTPGFAVGGLVRTDDRFVTGALDQEFTGTLKSYTNGDVYVAVTKTWLHPPVPFLVNLGWKATNASIYGLGGPGDALWRAAVWRAGHSAALRLPHGHCAGGRIYAGATDVEEPGRDPVPSGRKGASADHAGLRGRVTQKENPHFAFDIGIGQVAGNIGTTLIPTGNPAQPYAPLAVDLQARHVVGMGLSLRY